MDARTFSKVNGVTARVAPLLTLTLSLTVAPMLAAQTQVAGDEEGQAAFDYRERSTVDTIPFRSMGEETLANTVIEGGLEAPAAGVPVQPRTDEDFYLDPLAF